MRKFFLTLLAAAPLFFPSSHLSAFMPEDDEPLDQFMVTMGASGYILWQAIDLAKENHFRYLKILSAEYTLGNQSGSFVCESKGEKVGKIFMFEDDVIKITVSCYNVMPEDTDYIDAEVYKDLIQAFEDEEDDLSFSDEDELFFGDDDDLSFDDSDENDW